MISSIILTGVLEETIDSRFRTIISASEDPFYPEKGMINSKIPLLYWTRDKDNYLSRLAKGTRVVIRGHLEADIDVGLYVVCEYIEVIYETKNN